LAEESGLIPSTQQYITAFNGFLAWLRRWQKLYNYEDIFGYPAAKSVTWDPTLVKPLPAQKAVLRQMTAQENYPEFPEDIHTPSFSQVVSEREAGDDIVYLKKMTSSATTKPSRDNGASPSLPAYAPTGKKRTWGWKQITLNVGGKGRQPCNGPPPADAPAECEYLGDWLDLQGLCTYCLVSGHEKNDCQQYHTNVQKWKAAKSKHGESLNKH
jgi:hypothetical protein